MPPKARRTKPQTEVERELTRIIRKMVREAERDMVRTAHRLAKALAFNIDVKGLADSLHPLPEHVLKQDRGGRGLGRKRSTPDHTRFTRDDQKGIFSVPVTLPNLKAHLNVTTDADDDLLTGKLAASAEWIAKYTGIPSDDGALPAPVREATLQLAAHLYENREASLIGVTAQTLPFGMLDMLEPYREWVF